MYEHYWKLREKPFRNTPDPRYLFFSRAHEEALTRMLYTIAENQGAMLFTGAVGAGKTLLSRVLVDQLDPNRFDMAYIDHPSLTDTEILEEILRQFGYEVEHCSKPKLLQLLRECLQNQRDHGRTTIVLVDEAQMIENEQTLEELRLLLNFQQTEDFGLTLILVGQPELRRIVEDIPQLYQRLSVRYHLDPLGKEEAHAYIRHRLTVAGGEEDVFTANAEKLIVQVAEGVPRRINSLADMALLVGFGMKAPVIDDAIIRQVASDMEL